MIHIGEIDITRKVSGGQLYKPNFSGEIEIPLMREKKKYLLRPHLIILVLKLR